jgi:uncharacterized protein
MKRPWLLLPVLLLLASCGSGGPRDVYVLGSPVEGVARVSPEAGGPVVEVARVSLPDYLDSTDIQQRDGRNELKISHTGRWGERLSVGITRDLALAVAKRLPRFVVVRTAAPDQATRRVLTDIDAFDVLPDRRCVLTARWTIRGRDRSGLDISQGATIVTTAAGATDKDIVAAMSEAIDQLADRIAGGLTRNR